MAAKVSISLSPKKRKKIADQSGHPAADFIRVMNTQRAAAVARWYSQHSGYSLEEFCPEGLALTTRAIAVPVLGFVPSYPSVMLTAKKSAIKLEKA